MQVEHLIVAQNSSIDADNNSLSVFQMLEDVTIQSPGEQVQFPVQVIVVLKREDSDDDDLEMPVTLRVQNPAGHDLFSKSIPVKMSKEHRRSRIRLNFSILLELSGEYKIILNKNNYLKQNAEFSFHANMIRQINPQNPDPQQVQ